MSDEVDCMESYNWTMIVQEYYLRHERKARDIVQPTTINSPDRKLAGWENTHRGRYFVLRNVDRVLMRLSEGTVTCLAMAPLSLNPMKKNTNNFEAFVASKITIKQ